VKLHLEEGFDLKLVAQEVGACPDSVRGWVRQYQEHGRAGLEAPFSRSRKPAKSKLPPLVKQEIVAVKKKHPGYGVRRITHFGLPDCGPGGFFAAPSAVFRPSRIAGL